MSSALRQALANPVAVVIQTRLAAMIVGFGSTTLSVRLVLDSAGPTNFATVSLLASVLALLPFADLGLGTALTNETIRGVEEGDLDRVKSSLMTTLIVVGIVAFGVCSAFWLWALSADKFYRPLYFLGNPREFLGFFGCALALWIVSGLAYRILYGLGRTSLVIALQALGGPLALALTWIVAASGWSPWLFAMAPVIAAVLVSLPAWTLVSRIIIGSSRGCARPSLIVARRVLREGFWGALLMLGGALFVQSDRVLLAATGNSRELVAFAVMLPAFAAVQSLLSAVGMYLWPRYAGLMVGSDLTWARTTREVRTTVLCGLALAAGFVAAVPAYIWAIGYSEIPWFVVFSLFLFIVVQSSTVVPTSALSGSAHIQYLAVITVIAGLSKVVLSIAGGGYSYFNPALAGALFGLTIMFPFTMTRLRKGLPSGPVH